jgi:two-component system chemotaxis response regulator CheB
MQRQDGMRTDVIRVVVVDDSAFVRKVIRQVLSRSPFIEVVGTARNGLEALELIEQLEPDVITLDLNMPSADGLAFLKTQMAQRPLPVVVVSMASKDGQQVLESLEAGAVDFIQKPTSLANDKLFELGEELIGKVKAAATARLARPPASPPAGPVTVPKSCGPLKVDVVVIGISTGGPQALRYLIPRLPGNFPVPIVVVLHMPPGYTELFASSLNGISELDVMEAGEGQHLKPGQVLLAPAGFHLTLRRKTDRTVVTHLALSPLNLPHRPAADVLFQSAAETYGERALAVVMTGMGSDGTKGAAWIKARGGRVFAESEESCVVYGMPRSIIEAGLCDRAVPLGKMAATIAEAL